MILQIKRREAWCLEGRGATLSSGQSGFLDWVRSGKENASILNVFVNIIFSFFLLTKAHSGNIGRVQIAVLEVQFAFNDGCLVSP